LDSRLLYSQDWIVD